jgi:hypothetical protein
MSVRWHINGREVTKKEFLRNKRGITPGSSPMTQCARTWPMLSDAAGVHPDQIPEARAELQKQGVDANFAPDGRIEFRSKGHRKVVCEAMGLYDRNGGHGDPRKKN